MSNTARRTSMSYPNGRVVNLGYGSAGSIDDLFSLVKSAAISGESGNKVEYTRAGLGRFVKISYPQPGVEMSMIRSGGGSEGDSGDPYDGYDRFSRVQEMRWQNSSTGTPIDAWQWGYNEASNRTWKKNLVASSGQDEAYGYDGLYQVIRDAVGTLNTNRTSIGGIPGEEEDFTYDPTGNWLGYRKDTNGSSVLDQSRSNNKDNQLTQIDGSSALLSYDRAGNAKKTAPGTNGDWSKYYQPVWDAWNRLVEVKDENGTSVLKNAYDGLSRRITKESGGTVTHSYWSDRWKPVEERTGSSTAASRSYLWGERPGHRDELILRDRDTDGNGSLDERLYATMDYFNGTAVLNTSGTVLERYAYSAFGIRRIMAADFTPRSSSSYAWEFGFQGQFRDSETGWYNYGYRFYVPLLGRWINRDPIAEAGGVNFYGFAFNSSLNLVDQYGLDSIALNRAGAAGSRKAVAMTLRNPKRGSDGRVIKPFQNMGAPLLREYCGLICKFCDHSRGSPRRVIRETTPHPGTWPVLRPDGVDIPTCDPYTNEDTKESVSCEKAFGAGAIEIGTYHSHPSNSPFSKDDKGFARVRGKGNPIFKGTPDGEVEKFTPDLSTNPSQDNLFPGETSRVPTRN